jgi:hypothetical protein
VSRGSQEAHDVYSLTYNDVGMPESKFYDENEADEILRLAAGDSAIVGAMTRERLVATAAELGISADAVARAEQQMAQRRAEEEKKKAEAAELAEFKASQRRSALGELGSWFSTSILLVGIDVIISHQITWSVWPVGIWGLALLGQFAEALLSPHSQTQKFERWKRKKQRKLERSGQA